MYSLSALTYITSIDLWYFFLQIILYMYCLYFIRPKIVTSGETIKIIPSITSDTGMIDTFIVNYYSFCVYPSKPITFIV